MAKKKNQLVIDLGEVALSNGQRQDLQAGIHKVVASKMKSIQTANAKTAGNSQTSLLKSTVTAAPVSVTANITVTFTNTNPGASQLTATLRGQAKTIRQSQPITFANVRSADIILIAVNSLGSTTATIDINSTPIQLNFPPGSHSGTFLIN